MKSASLDATPAAPPDQAAVGREPASRVATEASVAGNARLAALKAKLADLALFTPEIVTAILEFLAS
jgi:hypothetical protein